MLGQGWDDDNNNNDNVKCVQTKICNKLATLVACGKMNADKLASCQQALVGLSVCLLDATSRRDVSDRLPISTIY